MLPKGCIWLTASYAKEAAENLNVKFAEACIGFKFRAGRATPNVNGIVIHEKHKILVDEKIEELRTCKERKKMLEIENQAVLKWCRLMDSVLNAKRLVYPKVSKDSDFSILRNAEFNIEEFDDI